MDNMEIRLADVTVTFRCAAGHQFDGPFCDIINRSRYGTPYEMQCPAVIGEKHTERCPYQTVAQSDPRRYDLDAGDLTKRRLRTLQ